MSQHSKIKKQPLNLFQILERGSSKIKKMHKKVIMLVGQTRAGKSCVFNWIKKYTMKGCIDPDDREERNIVYKIQSLGNEDLNAEMKNSLGSVTLVPNIRQYTNEISLADMAGFKDQRNFVGVIGVSYFLNQVFQHADQVKFIIVMDIKKVRSPTAEGVKTTIIPFLNLFKYHLLSKEQKDKFCKSVGVVISKTQRNFVMNQYEKIFETIADKCQIVDFLRRIASNDSFQDFHQAVQNQFPQPQQFIQDWQKFKNWNYINLKQISSYIGQNFVVLPYKQQILDLKQKQQDQYVKLFKVLQEKVNYFSTFSKIIGTAMKNFSQNCTRLIQQQQITNKQIQQLFNFSKLFKQLKQFLILFDPYDKIIKQTIQPIPQSKNVCKVLVKFFQISKIYMSFQNIEYESKTDTLVRFQSYFVKIIQQIHFFVQNSQQLSICQRLKFCLHRGIQQFIQLTELSPELSSVAINDIKDKSLVFFAQKSQYEVIQQIILLINMKTIQKLFPDRNSMNEFQKILNIYSQHFQLEKQDLNNSKNQNQIRLITKKLAQANTIINTRLKSFCNQDKTPIQQINASLKLIKSQLQNKKAQHEICNSARQQQQKILIIQSKIDQIICQMITIIINMKFQHIPLQQLAIKYAEIINNPHLIKSCYQSILKNIDESQKKQVNKDTTIQDQNSEPLIYRILVQYIEFCKKWALFQKIIQISNQLISEAQRRNHPEKVQQYFKLRFALAKSKDQIFLDFVQNCPQNHRFNQNQQTLKQLIYHTEQQIQKQLKNQKKY